jgi:formate/nitrite transporter FocA (FNT family)
MENRFRRGMALVKSVLRPDMDRLMAAKAHKKTAAEKLPDDAPATDRAKEREAEDEKFVPVIVKRTDEARRHPDDTLHQAVKDGLEQLYRGGWSLLLSAIAAGLILGFTVLLLGVMAAAAAPLHSPSLTRLFTALVYPIGYIICILSATQLFTEHTATAVYPVLDRRAPAARLLRLWGLVIVGNLLGTLASAGLLALAEPVVQAAPGYLEMAHKAVDVATVPLLASGILAGWLMAQAAWLVSASPQTSGQFMSIYAVTFVIGAGGLHHSIAGTGEWLTGAFLSSEITIGAGARFTGLALVGNLIGGSIFVAILNYVHIRASRENEAAAPSSE